MRGKKHTLKDNRCDCDYHWQNIMPVRTFVLFVVLWGRKESFFVCFCFVFLFSSVIDFFFPCQPQKSCLIF